MTDGGPPTGLPCQSGRGIARNMITPENVAMLVKGDEVYGIGTIERLYAEGWPGMTFVCMSRGYTHDWLVEHGARVELVEGLAAFRDGNSVRAVTTAPLAMRQAKRDARRVHALLSGRGVKIVHTQWKPQQMIAGHMRRLGYKSVWQINNNMKPQRLGGLGGVLSHRFARWGADLLMPASDFIAANWRGCGVRAVTIRNAAPKLFDQLSPVPDAPPTRCLVAGRLQESKGHHTAVEAVIAARERGHDVRLDIFGGPLEENAYADGLRRRIAGAGAEDAITFQGFCTDLRERHQSYHLGLQCRIDPEPCSLWVCETMVDGLPLLASATGGTPELVADGDTGRLYPAGDADALAGLLSELAADPAELARMREAAYRRGQEQFLNTRMLDQTLEAYNSLF
ncbi:GDP-mannose-dependent alpha-(1-6)-phosphatidylinositol monomannoside mannosyltransferase [Posidoniimonas corsicana]|uniref:GDP-mannose-dependent alpha-(1-6)-phosphatidylinositol monomannoside mannosyltransferase n=2 Tax=Posidoniimonas corsicana TaxID=1938618 RepID=A0A5C5VDP0_9BACT|nr:GDP-mannose-dependent alpha-(1-6)-phosphatidylinositol monomannoside mannosyltransferase [Posidoniimonas corsicana]